MTTQSPEARIVRNPGRKPDEAYWRCCSSMFILQAKIQYPMIIMLSTAYVWRFTFPYLPISLDPRLRYPSRFGSVIWLFLHVSVSEKHAWSMYKTHTTYPDANHGRLEELPTFEFGPFWGIVCIGKYLQLSTVRIWVITGDLLNFTRSALFQGLPLTFCWIEMFSKSSRGSRL